MNFDDVLVQSNDGVICTAVAELAFNLTFALVITLALALLQQDVLQAIKNRVIVHPTMEPIENPHHECYM